MQHIVLLAGEPTKAAGVPRILTRIIGGPMRARDCIPLTYNFSTAQRRGVLPSKTSFSSPRRLQSALRSVCSGPTHIRDVLVISWQHPVYVPQSNISTVLMRKAGGLTRNYTQDAARPHLCIWVHEDAPLHLVVQDLQGVIQHQSDHATVTIRVVGSGGISATEERFGSVKVW